MVAAYRLGVFSLGLFLAFVALASTNWNMGSNQTSLKALTLLPGDPSLVMQDALQEFGEKQGEVTKKSSAAVRQAARYNLVEGEPLLFEGIRQIGSGAAASGISLLEEARRRDPRSRAVRITLLNSYLRNGNAKGAFGEAGALSRLLPGSETTLVPILANLVIDPATRSAAVAALPDNPLRFPVIDELVDSGASSFMILAITPDLRGAKVWADRPINTLINRGDVEGAYRLWKHTNTLTPPVGSSKVIDGEFDAKAGPPFGWDTFSGSAGLAEIRDGSLSVQYYGRQNTVMARQLLMLQPGTYRLEYAIENAQKEPADLAWRIECLDSGARLLELPFQSSFSFEDVNSKTLIVPSAKCAGQWLSLAGRAMVSPETRASAIDYVRIVPAGAP